MKPTGLLSLACAALLTVACNSNNRTDVARTTDNGAAVGTSGEVANRDVSRGDRNFVEEISYAGMAEVEIGRIAADRAVNPDVKRFAQMMVDDHTKAGNELKQIATQFNIPTPAGLDEKHQELKDKLSKLRGADFDREYMDAMVNGHQDVVDKLESRVDERNRTAVLTGQEPKDVNVKPEAADNQVEGSLNTWAANTLPAVKAHLDRAKAIKDTLDRHRRNNTE